MKKKKNKFENILSELGTSENLNNNIGLFQDNLKIPTPSKKEINKIHSTNKDDIHEFKIAIDLGGEKEEIITSKLNESPSEIARQFSEKFKLSNEIEKNLANLLENKIKEKTNTLINSNNERSYNSPFESEIFKENAMKDKSHMNENSNLKNLQADIIQESSTDPLYMTSSKINFDSNNRIDANTLHLGETIEPNFAKSAKNLRNNEKLIPAFNELQLMHSVKKYFKKNNNNKMNLNKSQNIQTFLSYENVFERLYDLASIQKSEKKNKIKEEDKKKIEKQLLGLTLTPDINLNSKKVIINSCMIKLIPDQMKG